MEQATALPTCPQCHVQVRPSDYFCFNCGKVLHEKPMSVSVGRQIALYIGSVVLVPFGVIWGFRYLRQPGTQAKMVGLTSIIITIVTCTFLTFYTINFVNQVQDELHKKLLQMNSGY